jgi:hypothetical protein
MSLDDRLKRDLPRLAAETDPDVEPALQRVVSGGRRRKMMYRAGAALAAAAVVVGAALVGPRVVDAFRAEREVRPGTMPSPTGGMTALPGGGATVEPQTCSGEVPFRPGYLPEGFSEEMQLGPAPGAPAPEKGQWVVHWTDGQGNSFEARNPGTLFAELAQEDDAPTITVLGEETPDFGPLAPMTTDYLVQFTIEAKGQKCSLWSLNEYGLSLNELKRVAEGLEPA